jgi:hypothetical protein
VRQGLSRAARCAHGSSEPHAIDRPPQPFRRAGAAS